MNLLQSVNTILRKLGENPLASLDIQYPTLALVLPAIDEATNELLSEGWWFNTRYNIKLVADVNGDITVPNEIISFYPDDETITFEGTRFINKDTGDLITDQEICGKLVTLLDFEKCPNTARYLITYLAAFNVYVADNGQDNTSQSIQVDIAKYQMQLSGEHTRMQKFTARKRPTVLRWYDSLRG
jgi:hypothetical protein